MNPAPQEVVKGDLMKVVYIDDITATAFLRISDGRTARVSIDDTVELSVGDVVLSHDEGWVHVPDEVWSTSRLTSVIRRILKDGTILGETGTALFALTNSSNLEVAEDQTVEIDGASNITRILHDEPIRVRPLDHEDGVRPSDLLYSPDPALSFEDFGGSPDVVQRARELIGTQLQYRDRIERMGAKPIRGVLFSGPPGTGKTFLARIIANQGDADFYAISGPSIVSKWVGDSEQTLRKIFEAASSSKRGKAIIFFDEIDSIAEKRSDRTHDSSRKLVGQLLTLMDGLDGNSNNIVVVAATNRVTALDPALTRPGRFDWEVKFENPNLSDREQILLVGMRRIAVHGNLPICQIAERTEGWSAADLNAIWSEAALVAAMKDRSRIGPEDMVLGYERVAAKPKPNSRGETT